jgi:hypothetical protein
MKLKFLIFAVFAAISLSFTPSKADAKKIRFDIYQRDTNGVTHHIHGWVDVNLWGFSLSHADVWYDNTHFVMSIPNFQANLNVDNIEHNEDPDAIPVTEDEMYDVITSDSNPIEV